jgi:hypothetical protein
VLCDRQALRESARFLTSCDGVKGATGITTSCGCQAVTTHDLGTMPPSSDGQEGSSSNLQGVGDSCLVRVLAPFLSIRLTVNSRGV